MIRSLLVLLLAQPLISPFSVIAGSPDPMQAASALRIERAIDSILAGLSIQEKIGQLVQYTAGWSTGPSGRTISSEQRDLIRAGKTGSLLNVFGSALTR